MLFKTLIGAAALFAAPAAFAQDVPAAPPAGNDAMAPTAPAPDVATPAPDTATTTTDATAPADPAPTPDLAPDADKKDKKKPEPRD